jgi:MFS family permease
VRARASAWLRNTPWLRGLPREVAVLSAVAFCVALGFGIVGPAIPIFADEFGVTAFWATAVVSVFALMRLVGALPAGWLVDRTGERITLATGLGIVAVSSALAGLSTTYAQLLVLRGIGGLGSAMFTVSALALLLRVAAPDQRGRSAAAFQGGFLLGGVAGPAVGGIALAFSIRLPFFIYAGTLAAAVVVTVTMLRRTELHEKDGTAIADEPVPGWTMMRKALRNRAYVTALVVNLGNGFTAFGLRSSIVPLFVVNGLGLGRAWAGYGAFASAIAQAPLLGPAGRATDTLGRRRSLIIGLTLSVAAFAGLLVVSETWGYMAAMAVLGAASAYLGAAPAAVVGDVTEGRREGPVVATFQMMSDVGAVVGPLVAGIIVDRTGSYDAAFAIGVAVLLATLVLSATMPETLRRAPESPGQTAPT